MNKQLTLSGFADELAQAATSKKAFLDQIDRIVPWGEWIRIIKPFLSEICLLEWRRTMDQPTAACYIGICCNRVSVGRWSLWQRGQGDSNVLRISFRRCCGG